MKERLIKYAIVVGFGTVGGVIIKKLNDIHAEIEYLEHQQGIYNNRKDYEKIMKERYGDY